jgi:hypothetical protein
LSAQSKKVLWIEKIMTMELKKDEIEWNECADEPTVSTLMDLYIDGKSALITGSAGFGKTYLLQQFHSLLLDSGLKVSRVAFTNIAAHRIDGTTIHKYFHIYNENKKASDHIFSYVKDDVLLVDEISMVPEFLYEYILRFKTRKQVFLFGDFKQCPPVEDDMLGEDGFKIRGKSRDYFNSELLKRAADHNHYELRTIRRHDAAFAVACRDLDIAVIREMINPMQAKEIADIYGKINICYTNYMRIAINDACGRLESRKKCQGRPVICKANFTTSHESGNMLFNNDLFIVLGKSGGFYRMKYRLEPMHTASVSTNSNSQPSPQHEQPSPQHEQPSPQHEQPSPQHEQPSPQHEQNVYVSVAEYKKHFHLAHAITIHCIQGATIREPYVIHNYGGLLDYLKYTALTRASDPKLIQFGRISRSKFS